MTGWWKKKEPSIEDRLEEDKRKILDYILNIIDKVEWKSTIVGDPYFIFNEIKVLARYKTKIEVRLKDGSELIIHDGGLVRSKAESLIASRVLEKLK